jgi:hypothetical protein
VLVDEHEAAAAEVAGKGIDDGERESDGDCCVDGVASGFEDVDPGVGGEVMYGDDHGVRGADGLIALETEGGLGCVVWGGVLWGFLSLRGEREREGEEDGGDGADGMKGYLHGLEKDCDWSIVRRNGGARARITNERRPSLLIVD